MSYTEADIDVFDIDWFAIDLDGFIGHFASAGKVIPASVASSKVDNEELNHYFREVCPPSSKYFNSPALSKFITFFSPSDEDRHLRDSRIISSRGVFSYDTRVEEKLDCTFFGLTFPESPRSIDRVPIRIADLLNRTKFNGLFKREFEIDIREIQ